MAAVLLAGWGNVGNAAVPQDDPFAGLEVLDAAEMAEKRGGFFDAALGISLSLGADIFTSINGSLVLKTMVTFVDSGPITVSHTVEPGADLTNLAFLSADGMAVVGPIPGLATMGAAVTLTAVNGVSVTVPAGFEGLVAQSETGIAAAVSKITTEQFANLVINSEPGAAIQQDLQIKLDVQGFSQLQQAVRLNASMARLRQAMRSASLGALGIN